MAVTGLPVTLTEFSTDAATPALAAQVYTENLRMMFGSPEATSFLIWEAWPSPSATPDGITTIVDNNWNLTQSGQAVVNLLDSWKTNISDLVVGADVTIDFTGFYGEYEITVGGKTYNLDLTKGVTDYSILVGIPSDFDDDLDIDGQDLAICQAGYGIDASGDADFDGDTDGWGFLIWQRNFQAGILEATTAVPEPTTRILLFGLPFMYQSRRRGRQ